MSDHDRTLNERGRQAAVTMAKHIAEKCPLPHAIICSSAVRTQETLRPLMERLAQNMGQSAPKPRLTRAIYEAPEAAYLREISDLPDGQNVLVVGHNPTTESLAIRLTNGDHQLLDQVATGYPTGGLTILEFDPGPWADALSSTGRFISFTAPRLLHAQAMRVD